MVAITPIRTEADYDAALIRVAELMGAEEGSAEGEELAVLVDLVELYEDRHFPVPLPDPVAAIEFRMDQAGLTQRDLVPILGSRAKVSEVLSGRRSITMAMARSLHKHLGIPADVLLQERGAIHDTESDAIDFLRFPLREMAKRDWIPNAPDLRGRAEELMVGLIERAHLRPQAVPAVLFRRNDHRRLNAKTDEYALAAWQLRLMVLAHERPFRVAYKPGTVTPDFLRQVAMLSPKKDGPKQAKAFLADHGICFQNVEHLPRTYLDGAALQLEDGRPVIGLTLRYDRVDNFWFCLLHELAHIGRHLDNGVDSVFVDDLSLRGASNAIEDAREVEADAWAEEALIPKTVWGSGDVSSFMDVLSVAAAAGVHPAIVAGRIRHKTGNYRLLSQLVGTGEIRRQFEGEADNS